jgi:hypothetical protein
MAKRERFVTTPAMSSIELDTFARLLVTDPYDFHIMSPKVPSRKTTQHEDESGYRFGTHTFRFGEYVSIQDAAGELHTFRVVSVAPVV